MIPKYIRKKKVSGITVCSTGLGYERLHFSARIVNIHHILLPTVLVDNLVIEEPLVDDKELRISVINARQANNTINRLYIGVRGKLRIISTAHTEFTHIGNTKFEYIYGPDLTNWPIYILSLKFFNLFNTVSEKDLNAHEKLVAADYEICRKNESEQRQVFLKYLQIYRTIPQNTIKETQTEMALRKIFKLR